MNDTLFFHGKTCDNRRFTVAGKFEKINGIFKNRNTLNLGISICSNQDAFTKRAGRAKSEGRIMSHSPIGHINLDLEVDDKHKIHAFLSLVKDFNNLKVHNLQKKFNLTNIKCGI